MDSYFFSRFKEYNFLSVLYKKIIREDTSYFFSVNVSVFIGRVTENWPQSYRKSHEKAPDKTEKVSAEVKV